MFFFLFPNLLQYIVGRNESIYTRKFTMYVSRITTIKTSRRARNVETIPEPIRTDTERRVAIIFFLSAAAAKK